MEVSLKFNLKYRLIARRNIKLKIIIYLRRIKNFSSSKSKF